MEGSNTSQYNTLQAHGQMLNVFVVVTGETCGAHKEFITKLERKGQIQQKSVEESDYILAFCPSPSRTGADVQEAMGKIPRGKPVILVVMHHRYDVEARLDDSSRHVTGDDVILTVDTVFWEGVFLKCPHNKEAFRKVLKAVGYSSTTVKNTSTWIWDTISLLGDTISLLGDTISLPLLGDTNSTSTSEKIKQDTESQLFNVFVVVTGETGGAHETVIRQLEHKGQIQKTSVEESDYILAFCPSPSRTATDVQEAMGKIPSGKPVILVVMHHKHSVPDHLDDSSKHVSREDVKLTVDTLFWEGEFLDCSHNDEAFSKVLEAVRNLSTTLKSTENDSLEVSASPRPEEPTSTSTSEKKIKQETEASTIATIQETPGTRSSENPSTAPRKQIQVKSRAPDSLPPSHVTCTSEKKIKQDTKKPPCRDANVGNKDALLNRMKEFHPETVRILLHGPVGSGKSSFINSVSSVLKGRMTQVVHVDAIAGDTSYTTKYQTHTIKKRNKQNFPFVFNDIVGLGSGDDINMVLKGHIKDGYTFDPVSAMSDKDPLYNPNPKPEDKTHVLVLVIPAVTPSSVDSMKKMKDIADNMGIPQICILTKIDVAKIDVKKDVQNVYKSNSVQKKMKEVSAKVGIPMEYIFPVKNYHEETDLDDDIDVLILNALLQMIDLGKDFINKMESVPMSLD